MVPPADKLTDNGLIGQLVANNTKVSRDTLVQLFCFSSSGLIAASRNAKEPESVDEHCLSEIGVVNEQSTNRAEEL